jgi:ribonuclease BN (tRNA processing enzyme)
MKVTILGSGTGTPDGDRNSAGYFVELPSSSLMLDCGAGTVHALSRYSLPWQGLTHLFVTHFHVDHVGELAALMWAFKYGMKSLRTAPFTLCGPHGLDRVMKGLEDAYARNLFEARFPIQLRMLAPGENLDLEAGARLSVVKTPHTGESLAVRMDSERSSVCYTGDTAYSEEVAEFFSGADLLISECSFRTRREGAAHLSIDDVDRMASKARAARLVVTHFYFEVDEPALKRQLQSGFQGEVIVGRDGMTFEV